jgi:hypothetical protein
MKILYIDKDPEALHHLKTIYKRRASYLQGDVDAMNTDQLRRCYAFFRQQRSKRQQTCLLFDTVVISQVFNYIDYEKFLKKTHRILKKDGLIFVNNVVQYGIPDCFSKKTTSLDPTDPPCDSAFRFSYHHLEEGQTHEQTSTISKAHRGRGKYVDKHMKTIPVVVRDRMQKRYRYIRTEPIGKNFAPDFKPELTPKEMLALGVFGGKYMTDCQKEFPKSWFTRAKLCTKEHDASLNYFKVNASQPLSVWRKNGWIHPDDPRGWFQWYCRYYMGRRHPDDARQIRRWKAIKRHIAQVKKHCKRGDVTCHARQRQAILHWAYDSRKI